MLRPYLKIWEWEWIFGRAVKAFSSLGVRSSWFWVLGIKEGLVECATVCVKSVVILIDRYIHSYISVRMPNVSVSASWWLYDEVITMRYLSSRRLTLSVICPLLARRLGVLEICRPNFSGCGLLVWFLMGSRIVLMEVRTSIHSLYIYSFCHFCLNTRYHVCTTTTCLSTLLTIYTYRSTYYKLCRPCKTNKVIYSSMHALDM